MFHIGCLGLWTRGLFLSSTCVFQSLRSTDGFASALQPTSISLPHPQVSRLACILFPKLLFSSLDHFPPSTTPGMVFHSCQILAVLSGCFLVRIVSIHKCGHSLCPDDQVCCVQGNNTAADTCCKKVVDMTYYNIAMITRKLSGVLIMLLLFAVGYFVQRMLCSRTRQINPAHNGLPAVTTSQEPLVECFTPDSLVDPALAARLPSYDACKRLPTYEETVRDHGRRGRPETPMAQPT